LYFCFASGVAGLVVVFTQQLQTSPHALSSQNQKYFGSTNARVQGNLFYIARHFVSCNDIKLYLSPSLRATNESVAIHGNLNKGYFSFFKTKKFAI
jgi:hypothetical protein